MLQTVEMYKEWLIQGLKKPGKTQAGLAKELGQDPSVISKMVAGTRKIAADELPAIAKYIQERIPTGEDLRLIYIYRRGKVAAGVWREAETVTEEWEVASIPRDPRWPHLEQYTLEVEGDSVNQTAENGWNVICVPFWEARREILEGDLVHVERTNLAGQVECTLKRVRIGDKGPELWPESDNPKYQTPIPVEGAEGDSVEIKGLVIGVYNPHP